MAHIQHRPQRKRPWQVRYRDPSGRERARSFRRKSDAHRFAISVEADKLRGEWTDPRLSKTTVAEWSERWLLTKSHLKPKTLAGYESNLRAHVLPTFGEHQLRISTAWRDHGRTRCSQDRHRLLRDGSGGLYRAAHSIRDREGRTAAEGGGDVAR